MHRALTLLARASLVMVLATGCVLQSEGRIMRADITTIRTELDTMKQGVDQDRDALQKALQRAEKKTGEIEEALQKFDDFARRNDADFGVQMDKLALSVQELVGKLEEASFRLDRVEKRVRGDDVGAAPGASGVTAATAVVESPKVLLPADKGQATLLVAKLLRSKTEADNEDGKRLAKEALAKWPKEDGVSDVIHLALGDRLRNDKLFQKAVVEYKKVLDDHPKGQSGDDAMFRLADTFADMGYGDDAKVAFEELVKRYPKSALVKDAKVRIAELDKLSKKKPAPKKK